jgi:phage repressor protein C with HTH and peptisase S24 domain
MTQEPGDFDKFDASWSRVKKLTGWSQKKQLAEFLGIKGQSVSGARTRNSFPADWAYKIASNFDGSTDWIIEGRGPIRSVDQKEEEGFPRSSNEKAEAPVPRIATILPTGQVVIPQWRNPDPLMFDYIPMAEARLSAGGGCFVLSEEMEGYYAFRKSWLSRVASSAKNLVLMRVQGTSMHPTIQDGDTVMIDTGRLDIKEGMLYALRFDSTIMVKRITFRPGTRVQVVSDNRHEYDPFEADIRELHIIGQIIFTCRTLVPD